MSAIILKIQIIFFFYFLSLSWQPNPAKNTKKCHFKLKIFLKFWKQRSSKQIEILLNQKQKEKNEHILINYFILKLPKYKINNNKKFKPRNGVWDIGSVWIELIVAENWKLKTENWKHCSKIIFKCVNSIVGPIFNIF